MFSDLRHTASFILCSFLFSFQKNRVLIQLCLCDVDVDKKKKNVLTFFHRKNSKIYHPAKRSINKNN